MNCPTCQRDTNPVRIGESDFCSVCGNRYDAVPVTRQANTAGRRIDMAPRRGPVPEPSLPSERPQPAATNATQLHRGRGIGQGVIDLRGAGPMPMHSASPHTTGGRTPAAPLASTTHERHIARFTDRFDHAKQFERSPMVNKFADAFGNPTLDALKSGEAHTPGERMSAQPWHDHKPAAGSTGTHQPAAPHHAPAALPELPRLAATQHEAMSRLAPAAPRTMGSAAPVRPTPSTRPRRGVAARNARVLTAVAAIAVMASYIWFQNYPKLALQSASDQAGVAASLPGYLPSSYNLAGTTTSPGLVTLNFTSPSIGQILKIDQHRTSWDSSSLLDNYVAKQTDDYSTVHGQGLTIYLFGDNQAAWVNHGVWYDISGAARLSRDQILKIAYSL